MSRVIDLMKKPHTRRNSRVNGLTSKFSKILLDTGKIIRVKVWVKLNVFREVFYSKQVDYSNILNDIDILLDLISRTSLVYTLETFYKSSLSILYILLMRPAFTLYILYILYIYSTYTLYIFYILYIYSIYTLYVLYIYSRSTQ